MQRKIEQIAASHYKDLPYHNFQHVQDVARRAKELIKQCPNPVDEQVVYLAILFHDAGYYEDHQAKGFDSKEEYSAHIAREELEKQGFPEELIHNVQMAIMATHKNWESQSIEQKIVRAADVANIGGDYETFLANTKLLHEEYRQLTGKEVSWDKWKELTADILKPYLETHYEPADGKLTAKGRMNLSKLKSEDL